MNRENLEEVVKNSSAQLHGELLKECRELTEEKLESERDYLMLVILLQDEILRSKSDYESLKAHYALLGAMSSWLSLKESEGE